jgi:AraC-like DNA-binding protein
MTKTSASPTDIAEAIALREAGFTALAISQRLGISVRSLQRHFAATKSVKGAIKADLLEQARADLLARVSSESSIKEEAARLIADDLAHSQHLRQIMLAATEVMVAGNLSDAVQVMRAAAAYSTVLKNTSDIIRHSLRADRFNDAVSSELPELVVREMTADEVAELRNVAARHDATVEDNDDGVEDNDDGVMNDPFNEVIEEGV